MVGVSRQIQAPQPQGAQRQRNTANGAQQFGQTCEVVGCGPIEQVVINGCNAGSGKAQHEAIKREMVRAFSGQGEGIVFVVAALTMATAQIFQTQGIVRRFCCCGRTQGSATGGGRYFAPKLDHPQSQRQH